MINIKSVTRNNAKSALNTQKKRGAKTAPQRQRFFRRTDPFVALFCGAVFPLKMVPLFLKVEVPK